jgi:hypothetical protein
MIDSILLAATRISTFVQQQPLTNASGFFFARDERLFLVSSRHVLIDRAEPAFSPTGSRSSCMSTRPIWPSRSASRFPCTATVAASGGRAAIPPATSTWR